MKQIKLRAWDKKEKVMYEVTYIDFVLKVVGIGNHRGRTFESVELMKFTDLPDKNGKEIYEKDICREINETGEFLYKVVWDKYRGFILKVVNFKSGIEQGLGTLYTELEVIGNSYENKELLK